MAPTGSCTGPEEIERVLTLLSGDSLTAAPGLLGARLSVTGPEGRVGVRLTEVEAYRGRTDPGSHAFGGRTARNATMFEAAGAVYVYFTYGMHHCVNLVTGPAGQAAAVLLRGGQIVEGIDLARRRRPAASVDRDLARGPARLCAALGLTRADDGLRLGPDDSRLSLSLPETPVAEDRLRFGARTGVSGPGGDGRTYPWRFWIDGEPTVSPYRAAAPRRRTRSSASQ
ncbi:MAG: DNA-3-methyladenine glycosylase [Actinomyces sp.]|nr:DNA-3-methyladenine glycosylase [Actinomyces sp.]MDO4243722.1 DNA-3-methyladenine glycosylase [Actinomyces sp.]